MGHVRQGPRHRRGVHEHGARPGEDFGARRPHGPQGRLLRDVPPQRGRDDRVGRVDFHAALPRGGLRPGAPLPRLAAIALRVHLLPRLLPPGPPPGLRVLPGAGGAAHRLDPPPGLRVAHVARALAPHLGRLLPLPRRGAPHLPPRTGQRVPPPAHQLALRRLLLRHPPCLAWLPALGLPVHSRRAAHHAVAPGARHLWPPRALVLGVDSAAGAQTPEAGQGQGRLTGRGRSAPCPGSAAACRASWHR
mmetsp:Transcript_19598/g.65860  ORF Transcript_19598/g.65860 Transcript_19598/m.65860 type:complete len:248 (-) Transcript_19598:1772-2515(-)